MRPRPQVPSLRLRGGNLSDRGRFLREEGGGGWTAKAWPQTIHIWPRAFSLLTNLPWLTVKSPKVNKDSCHEIFKARPLSWRRVYGLVQVSIDTEKKNQWTIDRWQDSSAKWVTRVLSKEFKKGTVEEGGRGNPLQDSCSETSMDRGAWQATVHEVTKSQIQLSDWARMHVHEDPLYTTANSTQYSVMAYLGKESKKEWIYV